MKTTFNVLDYGGKGGTDCTAAFEKALADAARAAASGPGVQTEVYVPGDTLAYLVTRPLRLEDGVSLRGDGLQSQITAYGWPAFVAGVAKRNGERPDLFGVLDASAAPASGVRRGVRVGNGTFLQLQFHDLCIGRLMSLVDWQLGHDCWEKTDALTVDVCLIPPPPGWAENVPLVGVGQGGPSKPQPSPWFLTKGPKEFGTFRDTVIFQFSDERWDGEDEWGCHGLLFGLAGIEPPYKIACQVDLKTATAAVFVNGIQVPWLYYPCNTGSRVFELGHRFKRNEDWPLYVGADGGAPGGYDYPVTPLTLAGLHVSARARYLVGKPGDPQKIAVTGTPPNDMWQFFEQSATDATVGYLPLNDVSNTWTVNAADARQVGSALWMSTKQQGNKPSRVEKLSVHATGPAFAIGAMFGMSFDRVKITSNESVAIGSWRVMADYPMVLRDCDLSGGDAPYYGFRQIIWADNTVIGRAGRDGIRLRGCESSWYRVFSAFLASYTERFISLTPDDYAGQHGFYDVLIDTEGPGFGTAVIEAWAAAGQGARLVIGQMDVGTTRRPDRPPVPVVKLRDHPLGGQYLAPSWFEVRGFVSVAATPDYSAVVESDGPNWHGVISAPQLRSATPAFKGAVGLGYAIRVEDTPSVTGVQA